MMTESLAVSYACILTISIKIAMISAQTRKHFLMPDDLTLTGGDSRTLNLGSLVHTPRSARRTPTAINLTVAPSSVGP